MPDLSIAPWQYAAIYNPFQHFAMYGGVAVGKTYTGSHFSIHHITEHPQMTGLIGANTYDQLSQVVLRAFFSWLEEYDLDYVVDCIPPKSWGQKRALKSYKNTVSIFNRRTNRCTLIFTRTLSDPDALRGIEISWYWLDETRDTSQATHDVVISRMRETKGYIKGLITTTTNGEDWSYKRFVLGQNASRIYGSMHVPTMASVELGIIDLNYYNTMAASYSPLMALQELEAKHINVFGGKAYYAASDKNRQGRAPWGASFPDRDMDLIIGCDFNFAPAPLVWMVGQRGPNTFGPNGEYWYDHIHWFGELSGREMSSVAMTLYLLQSYPDFFYRIYGDVSGGIGTTSNAGVTDYDQIAATLADAGARFTVDFHQLDEEESRANPRVRTRVENMNSRFCNAMGEIRQTYDPARCTYFDGDVKMVGWKSVTSSGRGKLDDGGDGDRTHASDAAGYAVFKLFPPGRQAEIIESLPSQLREEYDLMRQP